MARLLPGQVGTSATGEAIRVWEEDDGSRRYVVVRGDTAYYSDENGNVPPRNTSTQGEVWAGVLIGGVLGALLGPWGAVLGAAVGGAMGEGAKRAKNA